MAQIVIIVAAILLLLLTAFAGYTYTQIRLLSLPISHLLALFTVLLPPLLALTTSTITRLLRHPTHARTIISASLFTLQTIITTALATLALAALSPGCSLEDQWLRLYRAKDANAIRTIQDQFDCCGFNSVVDRAWPFPRGRPEDGLGPDQCTNMYGREMPCVGPWRAAEKGNAGALFAVAAVVFIVKIIILFPQARSGVWTQATGWTSFMGQGARADDEEERSPRLLIHEGGRVSEEEPYQDEIEEGHEGTDSAERENGSRPRIEPSRLSSGDGEGGGEPWRE